MIDIRVEPRLLTFSQAAEIMSVSYSTVRRYALFGHRGRKLEKVRVGGGWRTSHEAIQRFLVADGSAQVAVVPPGVIEELRMHGCSR